MKRLLQRLAALATFLAAPWVFGQSLPVVQGEAAWAPKSAAVPRLRLAAPAREVVLSPVPESALAALREANGKPSANLESMRRRLLIGVTRELDATHSPALEWQAVTGGHAARLALTSPDAGSLRLAIDLRGLPLDTEMVFQGSALPDRLEGPVRVGEVPDRTAPWWSPLTEGERQVVEFFVPARHEVANLAPALAGASHVVTTPSSRFTKRLADIGVAGSCNVDIACSALGSQPAFREAVASVAQMVFTDGGFTGLCTGTLLNDSDNSTQVPWFYSANHCFDESAAPFKTPTQMQAVANTLSTLWFFEAQSCRGTTPVSSWTQQAGGATYLYSSPTTDVLFVRLNNAPPAGAFFSGWDANPLSAGSPVISIHHPRGDLKKVTQGSMLRFGIPGVAGGNASYIETQWTNGTTEQGSSGAGVWSASAGAYAFRGGLYGGTALCSNPTGTDYFSRLDLAYPSLAQYLSPTSATPIADFTDLWWNPAESGWGLSLVQHASRVMFGVWYTYGLDGKRTWFVLPSGTWTNSRTYTGLVYATTGPAANGAFDPARVRTSPVGSATLTFSDANNGTFAYTINGLSGSKTITRQPF
jgi:lysyl endopeptidase